MGDQAKEVLTTEKVAYWYFRLNGYLQMESFIVHPESGGGGQRTEADLIGVRFPYRAERLISRPDDIMQDDFQKLELSDGCIDIVIVEVKTNRPCDLNGPWTNKDLENVQRVLAAIGCFPTDQLDEAADSIYSNGIFEDETGRLRVRLIAIGASKNEELSADYPRVVQITWREVLGFIGDRLFRYRRSKRNTNQWDDEITLLKDLVASNKSGHQLQKDGFIDDCLRLLGVHS